MLAGASILKLHIASASLFVGVGGSLNAAHDDIVIASDAVGFSATGMALDYASAMSVPAGVSYSALHLHVAALTLHGISGLELFVTNLDVSINQAASGAKVDWSAQGIGIDLDADASDLDVAADFAVNIGDGLVVAAGSVEISRHVGSGLLAGASILKLHIASASLFVGVGGSLNAAHDDIVIASDAVGFSATGVALDYASAMSVPAGVSYSALHLHVAALTLHGI